MNQLLQVSFIMSPTLHMHRQPRITRHVKKVFRMRDSNKENMEGSGTRKGEEDILKN